MDVANQIYKKLPKHLIYLFSNTYIHTKLLFLILHENFKISPMLRCLTLAKIHNIMQFLNKQASLKTTMVSQLNRLKLRSKRSAFVILEVSLIGKTFPTPGARVWLFPRVNMHMCL